MSFSVSHDPCERCASLPRRIDVTTPAGIQAYLHKADHAKGQNVYMFKAGFRGLGDQAKSKRAGQIVASFESEVNHYRRLSERSGSPSEQVALRPDQDQFGNDIAEALKATGRASAIFENNPSTPFNVSNTANVKAIMIAASQRVVIKGQAFEEDRAKKAFEAGYSAGMPEPIDSQISRQPDVAASHVTNDSQDLTASRARSFPESMPLVPMTIGLAVIAPLFGGLPEVVSPDAMLVEEQSPQAVAGALQRLPQGDGQFTADGGHRASRLRTH